MYLSAWKEESSSYYTSAINALTRFDIHPSSPTLILFWERDCTTCEIIMEKMKDIHLRKLKGLGRLSSIRIYGIHLTDTVHVADIYKFWSQKAPRGSLLIIDKKDLLKTGFQVKSVPKAIFFLPRKKKIFSTLGGWNIDLEKLPQIIQKH